MSEWQPIETAPKDGRVLRLFDQMAFDGFWVDGEWRPAMPNRALNGEYGNWGNARTINPTHWQWLTHPIPTPPRARAALSTAEW